MAARVSKNYIKSPWGGDGRFLTGLDGMEPFLHQADTLIISAIQASSALLGRSAGNWSRGVRDALRDECIDCGVCEPDCPVDAIKPATEPGLEKWLSLNENTC